ncbi:NERD domain-containing protein [Neobacillus sp. MM2021_6]|uniref:nuclease-related domain-containing protein n=1 Tax=Bacillaceae TaxID=186817 RepID=UPI00140C3D80|nr:MULTISPECIES: nuclease-related domain-containing protein [Bacillaceae]MBO0961304.1 NERD domain-containing protein [Neobacillus sp. MM2021_6]NHC18804.1 NERD domain-containing protein [Bacillus sp. MM2020_4]
MAYKPRIPRVEMIILCSLHARWNLSDDEKRNYLNLKKGFEGEVQFDSLTEKLASECLIVNDLLLEVNKTKFQIDTLLVQDKLYLFDVKNLESDYCFENGEFYYKTGRLTNNPLTQLRRCENLFRQLLQKYGYHLPVEPRLVFINPEFTLYQAPKNEPLTLPTQVSALMRKLNSWPGKINEKHRKLADLLVSLHQVESPYTRVPHYDYEEQQKGIICISCQSFALTVNGRKLICDDCGCEEGVDAAVLRSVKELKLLFPVQKITTNVVYEWCGGIGSKKMFKRILSNNLKSVGYGQWTCYE